MVPSERVWGQFGMRWLAQRGSGGRRSRRHVSESSRCPSPERSVADPLSFARAVGGRPRAAHRKEVSCLAIWAPSAAAAAPPAPLPAGGRSASRSPASAGAGQYSVLPPSPARYVTLAALRVLLLLPSAGDRAQCGSGQVGGRRRRPRWRDVRAVVPHCSVRSTEDGFYHLLVGWVSRDISGPGLLFSSVFLSIHWCFVLFREWCFRNTNAE